MLFLNEFAVNTEVIRQIAKDADFQTHDSHLPIRLKYDS